MKILRNLISFSPFFFLFSLSYPMTINYAVLQGPNKNVIVLCGDVHVSAPNDQKMVSDIETLLKIYPDTKIYVEGPQEPEFSTPGLLRDVAQAGHKNIKVSDPRPFMTITIMGQLLKYIQATLATQKVELPKLLAPLQCSYLAKSAHEAWEVLQNYDSNVFLKDERKAYIHRDLHSIITQYENDQRFIISLTNDELRILLARVDFLFKLLKKDFLEFYLLNVIKNSDVTQPFFTVFFYGFFHLKEVLEALTSKPTSPWKIVDYKAHKSLENPQSLKELLIHCEKFKNDSTQKDFPYAGLLPLKELITSAWQKKYVLYKDKKLGSR